MDLSPLNCWHEKHHSVMSASEWASRLHSPGTESGKERRQPEVCSIHWQTIGSIYVDQDNV